MCTERNKRILVVGGPLSPPTRRDAPASERYPGHSGAPESRASRFSRAACGVGSFASRANADNLLQQLKAQGLTVYLSSGGSGQALRYRVRIGPLADRNTAERTAAKLKSLGHVSTIVAPGS